ncbi:hypothetical protein KS4_10070 [Poriferisphaera corsica]|uniref:Glycosyl hydrolase-like 10 domain-containing protein n=1 Tax=Poriferisphaera corsica TaxID=2528020 RepID=A0A517YRX4_9BACT|nr:family 10 glycosylhydrolase [Poriferisphaera corsica]QDU32968.1 hypothetical protein KS4_10070 [Poriferisphaera corsica]
MHATYSRMTIAALALCTATAAQAAVNADTKFNDYRGLWVTRYEYKYGTEAGVKNIMRNSKLMGLNNISFQIRGSGDAYYDSAYETKAISWDALDPAVNYAHGYNMKLHAYMNTMPMMNGSSTPSSNHVWSQNPDWRLKKADGSTQPLGSGYVTFNPVLPEVKQHLANVAADIATKYDVDGIHLDYIRMIGNAFSNGYMADSKTVNYYRQAYGLSSGQYVNTNSSHYKAWVAAHVTQVVDSIDDAIKAINPDLELSAATWGDPNTGSSSYQQDAKWWVQHGNVDAAMPMIYAYGDSSFQSRFDKYPGADDRQAAVIAGIGVYLKDQPTSGGATYSLYDLNSQLNYAKNNGANGYQMFSYSDLVNSDGSLNAFGLALRDYNRNLIRETAQLSIIEDFENGDGYFNTSPTYSGSNQGISGATSELTDQGQFGKAQKLTIDGSNDGWRLRYLSGIDKIAATEGNKEFFTEGYIGFWLKTTNQDMSASIIIDDPDTGEYGIWQEVIGDGLWHLYEWKLDDIADWNIFASGGGDGDIDLLEATIDGLYFKGVGDAEFMIDTIAHNPFGSLTAIPEPAALTLLALSGILLQRRKRA